MYRHKIITSFALLLLAGAVWASPYATEVVSYAAGTNATSGYTEPSAALDAPRRRMPGDWGGDLTPFNAEWYTGQIVSIGIGGSLVVGFDHQVLDNPAGVQYGIDFLVFGNAFYTDTGGGVAGGILAEPVDIAVSQDGIVWYDIANVTADDEFPTMGYTNTSGPYSADGTIETDYTQAVDSAFLASGKNLAQLQVGYDGAGGGTGVDISGTGLPWIQYVKVYQDSGNAGEIDAFADVVPEPATLIVLVVGGLALLRGNRKQ